MSSSKLKTTLIILLVSILLVAAGYLAADRYLIQHVEIQNVNAYVDALATPAVAATSPVVSPAASLPTATVSAQKTVTTAPTAISADGMSYKSSSLSISIKKVVTGTGNNALVYFVADVVISDATQLSNAFANNQFGRNIIAYTSTIAKANNAIFAINGDYYGFRSDGIVIRNGVIFRNVPARTGLAFYKDGTMKIYDETKTTAQALLDAGVWNTLSFGPALLVDGVMPANLDKVEVDTNFGNHSIQGNQPRTGVGIISSNHFIFIVVDGRANGYSRGATMTEFATMFKVLGCTQAYNIDGGGSTTMYFNGKVVNNPLGKNQERGTSDILMLRAQ